MSTWIGISERMASSQRPVQTSRKKLCFSMPKNAWLTLQAGFTTASVAAQSLGLDKSSGAIAPGLDADIIAVEGNPLDDITAVRHVSFVMKCGRVYRKPWESRSAISSFTGPTLQAP